MLERSPALSRHGGIQGEAGERAETRGIEVWTVYRYKVFMEQYFSQRCVASNADSDRSCPDSCKRYGCREADLHLGTSLVDLVAISKVSGQQVSEIFKNHCKIRFDPLGEAKTWVGRSLRRWEGQGPSRSDRKDGFGETGQKRFDGRVGSQNRSVGSDRGDGESDEYEEVDG